MSASIRLASFATCFALAVVLAGTGPSAALSRTIEVATFNGTPIDLPSDNTPVDLPDNTPVDIEDPFGGLNDAVLDGAQDDDAQTADGALVLNCRVDGDDLIITNQGAAIPAGTKVKWAAGNEHGAVQLPNGLKAGQKARIDDALAGDAATCSAEAVL